MAWQLHHQRTVLHFSSPSIAWPRQLPTTLCSYSYRYCFFFFLSLASSYWYMFLTDEWMSLFQLQNVILMVHFFSGLILMVISFVMGLIPATVSANSYLKVWVLLISWPLWALKKTRNWSFFPYDLQNFFRLSPGFCFSDGLASLALLRQGMKDKSSHGVFDWNVTGASIFYLGLEVRGLPFLQHVCSYFYWNPEKWIHHNCQWFHFWEL